MKYLSLIYGCACLRPRGAKAVLAGRTLAKLDALAKEISAEERSFS